VSENGIQFTNMHRKNIASYCTTSKKSTGVTRYNRYFVKWHSLSMPLYCPRTISRRLQSFIDAEKS